MRRVAVVENESESLRSGYANVTSLLRRLHHLKDYSFDRFDANNLQDILGDVSRLAQYDALFISTNATSDRKTAAALAAANDVLSEFLTAGKGIYVGNQKKDCIKSNAECGVRTSILPAPYSFHMVVRPSSEPDSGQGRVEVAGKDSVDQPLGVRTLMTYPERIRGEDVLRHCLENDFKKHVYRNYLCEEVDRMYAPVLIDTTYGSVRNLLMVNRAPVHGERVVISTMALDWEGQTQIVSNIVRYIAEGAPRLAFVGDIDVERRESGLRDLVAGATLASIPHSVYQEFQDVEPSMRSIHDTYVVGSDVDREELSAFWKDVATRPTVRNVYGTDFRLLFQLSREEGLEVLRRTSNYGAVDSLLNATLLWLEAKYDRGLWLGGFWNTHDVLELLLEADRDVSVFLAAVCSDIKPHVGAGGYDGVMAPTCGLLSLLSDLSKRYGDLLQESGLGVEQRKELAEWILSEIEDQSQPAKELACVALAKAVESGDAELWDETLRGRLSRLLGEIRRISVDRDRLKGFGETDLCRMIEALVASQAASEKVDEVASAIYLLQESNGCWSSVAKTATVLIVLLRHYESLHSSRMRDELDNALYIGVQYLRQVYDARSASWDRNVQTTASAMLAILLYHRRFTLSTQEFFDSTQLELVSSLQANSIIGTRSEIDRLFERDRQNQAAAAQTSVVLESKTAEVSRLQDYADLSYRRLRANRAVAVSSTIMLLALILSLTINFSGTLWALISQVGPVLPLVVGALIAVPVTLLYSPSQPTGGSTDQAN